MKRKQKKSSRKTLKKKKVKNPEQFFNVEFQEINIKKKKKSKNRRKTEKKSRNTVAQNLQKT